MDIGAMRALLIAYLKQAVTGLPRKNSKFQMNRWKIVSQKTILKDKLFDVVKIDFEDEQGKKKTHNIVEKSPVVCVLPLTNYYDIYLISQYRYMLKKTVLEAVAGYVEEGETALAAAKRELEEEAGITAHQLEEIARVEVAASVVKGKVHLFLAKGLEVVKSNPEDDEEISVVKMPLKTAVEKVMSGEINHSASMIGILLLDKLR